jgi:hypothetical protein
MQFSIVVSCAILFAFPLAAAAESIRYTFGGVLSDGSYLQQSDDTFVDLSRAAFTATGIVEGNLLQSDFAGIFAATTVYDFGALGSFQTELGADRYVQFGESNAIETVGLVSWETGYSEIIGFHVRISPTAVEAVGQLQVLGDLTPVSTVVGYDRFQRNSAGQLFSQRVGQWFGLNTGGSFDQVQILSARVDSVQVPEPSTLVLLAVGALMLLQRVLDPARTPSGAPARGRRASSDCPGKRISSREMRQYAAEVSLPCGGL